MPLFTPNATFTQVPNIPARDALDVPAGHIVLVDDDGSGDENVYMWNGIGEWVILENAPDSLTIGNTFVVGSEAAMLALSTAELGDVAVRTDIPATFILGGTGTYSTLSDWIELIPSGTVTSVNGDAGPAVVLDAGDIAYSNVTSGLAATDVQAAIDELDTTLDTIVPLAHVPVTLNADTPTQDTLNLAVQELQVTPATATTYGVLRLNDIHDAVTLEAGTITQDSANLSGQELELVAVTTSTYGVMTPGDKTKLDGIETGATADQIASEVPYTNTTSGLTATDVQAAIDELDVSVDSLLGDQHVAVTLNAGTITQDSANLAGQEVELVAVTTSTYGVMTPGDKTKLDGIETAATADQIAVEVPYTNTTSGLTATDVQAAIDELDVSVDSLLTDQHVAITLHPGTVTQNAANLATQQVELVAATLTTYGVVRLDSLGVHDAVTLNADTPTQDSLNLSSQEIQAVPVTTTTYGVMIPADKLKLDGIETAATADQTAAEVPYVNTTSGLTATDVQAAIDELDTSVDSLLGDQHVAVTLNASTPTQDAANLAGQEIELVPAGATTYGVIRLNDVSTHDPITLNAGTVTQDSANLSTQELELVAVTTTTHGVMTPADKLKLDGIEPLAKDDQDADEVPYDNGTSGLTATDVQAAIDELEVIATSNRSWVLDAARNTTAVNLDLDLRRGDGTPTNIAPFIVPFNATITYLSATSQTVGNWTFAVWINDVPATSLAMTGLTGDTAVSVAVTAGDRIRLRFDHTGTDIDYPAGQVWIVEA